MKIFYGIDDNFSKIASASITSVIEHTQHPEIVILHKGLNKEPFDCFDCVSFYEVPDEWYELFRSVRIDSRYSPATFYRLIIPFITNDGLYIDADTIVETDVVEYCKPYKGFTAFTKNYDGITWILALFSLFRNVDVVEYETRIRELLSSRIYNDAHIINSVFRKAENFPTSDLSTTDARYGLREKDIKKQLEYAERYMDCYYKAKIFHYSMLSTDLDEPRLWTDGGIKFWSYWLKYKLLRST